ncbi:MAG: acyl-CoA reductase [Flavobacteriaceae bacterium]|nr:acyl-CoA reductase [Flavobacteriaceae bacterium]
MKFRSSDTSINTSDKIQALVALGEYIHVSLNSSNKISNSINQLLLDVYDKNKWFTENYVLYSLKKYVECFTIEKLEHWLNSYSLNISNPKNIGLILAGNIPAVGFHDVICAWLSGHHPIIKCSSKDDQLIPFLCSYIEKIVETSCFEFVDRLKGYDAVMATGTNNTIHHLEYYFRHVPNLLRRNRSSIAILNGDETPQEINRLGIDLFMYYGLGCRNVSKIYFPENYNLKNFVQKLKKYDYVGYSSKFHNNYTYQKAINFLQNIPFVDADFFLLQENKAVCSPISVIYYEFYKSIEWVKLEIDNKQNEIQCVVCKHSEFKNSISFGTSQSPQLWDYADGIDTMSFLMNL